MNFCLSYASVFSSFFTFKYGADVFPDRDAATVVKLTQGQLHVEERDAAKHCHQQVGQQEGTWGKMGVVQFGREGRRMTGDGGQKRGFMGCNDR